MTTGKSRPKSTFACGSVEISVRLFYPFFDVIYGASMSLMENSRGILRFRDVTQGRHLWSRMSRMDGQCRGTFAFASTNEALQGLAQSRAREEAVAGCRCREPHGLELSVPQSAS